MVKAFLSPSTLIPACKKTQKTVQVVQLVCFVKQISRMRVSKVLFCLLTHNQCICYQPSSVFLVLCGLTLKVTSLLFHFPVLSLSLEAAVKY